MLSIVKGDLWDFHPENWIVITTNAGWKANGENVMGAGVAKEAALRFPDLPRWYGEVCRWRPEGRDIGHRGIVSYWPGKLELMVTKEVNLDAPWLSWKANSTLKRVEESIQGLAGISEAIFSLPDTEWCPRGTYGFGGNLYMPPPGCGNGGLTLDQVMPLLEKYLMPAPTHFHLVLRD